MDRPSPLPKLSLTLQDPVFITPIQLTDTHPLYLSLLDQNYNFYRSVVHFFLPNPEKCAENVAEVVREALGKLLVHYHWAAGRLRFNEKQRLEVDCSNKGVMFVAGDADTTIAELGDAISTPNPLLDSLAPQPPTEVNENVASLPLLILQVIRFKCGGFCLSTVSHHTLFDGYSIALFLQNLGSVARGEGLIMAPSVDRAGLMPRNPPSPTFDHPDIELIPKEKLQTMSWPSGRDKRYVKFTFPEKMLHGLREEALAGKVLQRCTLFEALSAHVWRAKARVAADGGAASDQPFLLRAAVSLRHRLGAALPEGYLGNAVYPTIAIATIGELLESPLWLGVRRIQEAIAKITGEYIQSVLDWMELYEGRVNRLTSSVRMSSLERLPFYEVDLGWGKPLHYCLSGVTRGLQATYQCVPEGPDTRSMGLFVFMDEEERSKFQAAAFSS